MRNTVVPFVCEIRGGFTVSNAGREDERLRYSIVMIFIPKASSSIRTSVSYTGIPERFPVHGDHGLDHQPSCVLEGVFFETSVLFFIF